MNSETTVFKDEVEAADSLRDKYLLLEKEIQRKIIGQENTVKQMLMCIFSRGHCLLIGVPGLAKTLLVKSLAEALDLRFKRIQFTPDLMPSDIIGTDVLEEKEGTGTRHFRFIPGPLFANIILADEINRTPPKTQSALLEAMQEYSVTAGGKKYEIEKPFFVLATQNPIEQEGTYPLPEAQLDRFMFNLWIEYPAQADEVLIVKTTTADKEEMIKKILSRDEILYYQNLVRKVPVADNVVEYAVRLVGATRPNTRTSPEFISKWLSWGAGPRASQFLVIAAKANALLKGKYSPDIEEVREAAVPVLRHRIIPSFNAEADGVTAVDIITRLLETDKYTG